MSRVRDFLSELKTRRVYRAAVVYGVVAWVVVQAAAIAVPELLLPAWITRAVILVALLGFPLVLVLAWAYDITPHGMQRAGEPATPASPPGPAAEGPDTAEGPDRAEVPAGFAGHWARPMVMAVAAVVVVGGIGAYALGGDGGRMPRGEALLTELSTLSQDGRYRAAFDMARRAEAAGEVIPDSLTVRFTDRLTVLSDPPSAAVHARRYVAGQAPDRSEWHELGRTPLRGVAIARGDYHVRLEVDGHTPVERIVSGARARALVGDRSAAELQLDVRLLPEGRTPEGMVFVPGGPYRIASRDLQSLTAELDDFFMDRYEVTNAAFAEFVDGGGYAHADYWSDLAAAEGGNAGAVLRHLVDRTGLPGPREWRGQRPPPGTDQHPVTGVSWYEASAYCRFRQGSLPTLFEWEKAARDGITSRAGIELPWGYVGPHDPGTDRANFDGTGTTPVGAYPFGLSAYGAHDMAGNAKEWLRNRSESGRAVTGGSWADPIYVFSEVGSMAGASASETVGFRCARSAADGRPSAGAQGDTALRLNIETPEYTPVDDATFRVLLSHYQYDSRPLNAVVEERLDMQAWTRERVRYDGPAGERVVAYLFVPKVGRPPFQTMVFVPNAAVFVGNNVAQVAEDVLGPLVRAGRALFTVVMEGMTEREYPVGYEWPATNSVAFRDQMVRRATELRLGLDYLETRPDIDAGALAYVGASWGAGSRLLFAAIDDRFRATVLIGAGIDERVHPTLPEASNINFAPRISGPKLVVNGAEDEEHPWRTRALPLWNLLTEPRELALFDGVGHFPPAELRVPAIREFLDRHLD
jgi:eukaryotic-like serine/threonine-protein kinase